MTQFNATTALNYIRENFTLDGAAIRMLDSLFQYVSEHDLPDPKNLLMSVLDSIGFEETDWAAMTQNENK